MKDFDEIISKDKFSQVFRQSLPDPEGMFICRIEILKHFFP